MNTERLWKSASSLTVPGLIAVAGAGFALATLVMARVLDERQFSQAVLMIALCNVAIAAAPAGVNGVALRHERRADRRLVAAGSLCVAATALVAALLASMVYGLGAVATGVVLLVTMAGGMALLTRSAFQRGMALNRMVTLFQLPNIALLAAALLMAAGVAPVHWFPSAVAGLAYLLIGAVAWNWVLKHQRPGATLTSGLWRDGVNFASTAIALEVMSQLERLLLPITMGEESLALYAVAAATTLAPFRILELGTAATLVARLRRIAHPDERMRVLRRELALLLSLCVLGGAALLVIVPWFCTLVLQQRSVSVSLVLAVVVSGIARVCAAVAHSTAMAYCEGSGLGWVSAGSWLAVLTGAALGCAFAEFGFGLEGMVYGVSCGWMLKAVLAGRAGVKQLRVEPVRGRETASARL